MIDNTKIEELKRKAVRCVGRLLTMVHRANSGHVGGSLGATDVLVALYYPLNEPTNLITPTRPTGIDLFSSKGHCTPVIYALLASAGIFPRKT